MSRRRAFGLDIEDTGFGMVHHTDMAAGEHGIAKPITALRIVIFSRMSPTSTSPFMGSECPFLAPGHPSEGWLNRDEPIADGRTMLDILRQREFKFLVAAPDNILKNLFSDDALPPLSSPTHTDKIISGTPGDTGTCSQRPRVINSLRRGHTTTTMLGIHVGGVGGG
ncbi:hypothetical protein B0J13DRAFT_530579 [Dactylonectria estremocensis]|uniref:Uncharacterized protein n=1 Tax=Dactylonectria estremocensis TaxID=1079267 RepID=A0A9P9IQW3_9HYPO|nr:hypothetical protein B0J13DRAFT_530579 [Dactylonectria estremocensis]